MGAADALVLTLGTGIGGAVVVGAILVAVIYQWLKNKDSASAMKGEDVQGLYQRQVTENTSLTVDSLLVDSLEGGVSTDELSVEDLAGARLSVRYLF